MAKACVFSIPHNTYMLDYFDVRPKRTGAVDHECSQQVLVLEVPFGLLFVNPRRPIVQYDRDLTTYGPISIDSSVVD